MRDVKILLASHAHSDHVAGHALAQELTGAKVYVMQGDDEVIASGGEGQYLYTDSRWKPCPVDVVLKDGDEVKLGGATLVARRTPGHTRGCTTWTWRVADGDKKYDVVVIGSPNVNPGYRLVDNNDYPEIADDFAKTFKTLKSLPCDIFLGAHGGYYGMPAKFERQNRQPTESVHRPRRDTAPMSPEGEGVPCALWPLRREPAGPGPRPRRDGTMSGRWPSRGRAGPTRRRSSTACRRGPKGSSARPSGI